jgi:hypothetical protein
MAPSLLTWLHAATADIMDLGPSAHLDDRDGFGRAGFD